MHDRLQLGVGAQVAQLVGDVAVVDVDRHRPQLERGEHDLDVLGAVVEVAPDVVAGPDARPAQVVGQPVRPLLELAVGPRPVVDHQRGAVGDVRHHRLPQVGQVVGARRRHASVSPSESDGSSEPTATSGCVRSRAEPGRSSTPSSRADRPGVPSRPAVADARSVRDGEWDRWVTSGRPRPPPHDWSRAAAPSCPWARASSRPPAPPARRRSPSPPPPTPAPARCARPSSTPTPPRVPTPSPSRPASAPSGSPAASSTSTTTSPSPTPRATSPSAPAAPAGSSTSTRRAR